MQLSELRTQTRYYLADDNAKRWGVAEVDSYINIAYEYYYNRLVNVSYDSLIANVVLLDMTINVNTIALPTDFYKGKILYRFYPSVSTGATKKYPCMYKENFESAQLLQGMSGFYRPCYSFRGMNLLLDPMPDATLEEAFELHYWSVVTKLVNTTDSPVAGFSEQWQQLIPFRAAMIAKGLREEEDVSGIQNILQMQEKPFNDMLDVMTIARRRVEPFDTSGYLTGSNY